MEGQLPGHAAETLAVWHEMVKDGDPSRLGTIASEGIVFRSPAVFTPYVGREPFCLIISTVLTIFEEFRYHRTFTSPADNSVVLEFETRIGDRDMGAQFDQTHDSARRTAIRRYAATSSGRLFHVAQLDDASRGGVHIHRMHLMVRAHELDTNSRDLVGIGVLSLESFARIRGLLRARDGPCEGALSH